ncbi:MAG: redox-sensing transcriptional repressor Rex [Actinomycetota bacterium]|nr:redox-sensing transcriptional repressor Rex [Actinomycetota bacterium]MDQ3528150.1 redox-sensing transcriptional repressor Rex [Actinomycetota bacterium]
MAEPARRGVPEATVGRLPGYLRALGQLGERGVGSISSEELAATAGVRSTQLRKDLSHLGSYGVRGVGYDVGQLAAQISSELGLTQDWPVVIVGLGNLGRALAGYRGFSSRGFRIVALADDDDAVVGEQVEGLTVQTMADLAASGESLAIGVITTPAAAAQVVADRLVQMGVCSILNFAPCLISVPDGVDVRKVDLATELQILAFHEQRRALTARDSQEDVG